MKIKNNAGDGMPKDTKKERNRLRQASIALGAFIIILIISYVAATALLNNNRSAQNGDNKEGGNVFKDCKALEENCMDVTCVYYSWCGEASHKACKVYDCGKDYGIYSVSKDGKVETKREAKPDTKAIEMEKDACKGSMEILDQKCLDGRMKAKVKVTTKGECKIGGFAVTYEEGGSQPNDVVSQGDGVYAISVNTCGKIAGIIPMTEDGMSLEF